MDEIVANIVRLRALQAAVVALFAAAYVTVGDVKSLIVGREPLISTHYPPVHLTGQAVAYVTSPPALIPLSWSTDSIEALLYETKTVLRDSPSVISLTTNLPSTGIPRPRAPTSCRPQIPTKTSSTVFFPLPATSTPPPYRDSTASGDQNDGFDSTHLPVPEQHSILESIQGVFKQRVRVMTAETLNLVKLGLASFTTAKDRKINRLEHEYRELDHQHRELRRQVIECANITNWAADIAEAAKAEVKVDRSRSSVEIAQLRSVAEEKTRALTNQQWACKKKLEEAAEDTARSLQDMDAELEIEKEKASKALQKAQEDATREARHLTDLAVEQLAEAAELRKADEATINALRDQSAADGKAIQELSNQLNSIAQTVAQKDEKMASLLSQKQSLTKKIKDLTQEQDKLAKSYIDAETALKATIGSMSAKLELANKRCQVAEAIASYQEALVAQARDEQRVAEEKAGKLQAQAAKAKARQKAAEEEASRQKARMEAKKTQEAWQAQKELKKLYQQDPICSEVHTPSSDLYPQESSMLPHPQPTVRSPTNAAGQKDVCAAQNELVPWHDRLMKTKGETTPEERGLLANTPNGPRAEIWEEKKEER
ncbi:hypothetical protein BDR22DRAFT_823672 [Usnea florida]